MFFSFFLRGGLKSQFSGRCIDLWKMFPLICTLHTPVFYVSTTKRSVGFLNRGDHGTHQALWNHQFFGPSDWEVGSFVVHFMGSKWISPKDSSGMPCLTPDDAVHPCPGKPLVPRMWSGRASCGGAQQTPMELEFIFFITINKIAKDCWGCFVCLFFWYAFIYIVIFVLIFIYKGISLQSGIFAKHSGLGKGCEGLYSKPYRLKFQNWTPT